jgi:hypothetical protein
MEPPSPKVPPEMARFYGPWIGTWHGDRHILVVERIKPDQVAGVVNFSGGWYPYGPVVIRTRAVAQQIRSRNSGFMPTTTNSTTKLSSANIIKRSAIQH